MIVSLTLKESIRLLLLTIIIGYLIYCTALFLIEGLFPKTRECGIVKSKFNEEVSIKHGTKTELYLIMQFKTYEKAINVDVLTYSKAKVNDTLCFNTDVKRSFFKELSSFIGLLITIMLIGMLLYLLIMFIATGEI